MTIRQRVREVRRRWKAIEGILRGRQVAYRVKIIDGTMLFDEDCGVAMHCHFERTP